MQKSKVMASLVQSGFSLDLILIEISELNGIVRFIVWSVCMQFLSCSCAFKIPFWCGLIHWLLSKILIDGFKGFGTVFLSLISDNPRSRLLCWSKCHYCVDFEFWDTLLKLSSLLVWWCFLGYCSSSVISSEDQVFRILDTRVCSGPLIWLFSPAWDAAELTLPRSWLQLSFPGHWLQDECLQSFHLSLGLGANSRNECTMFNQISRLIAN